MKPHIRIYVRVLPFWEPCLYAKDVDSTTYAELSAAAAVLSRYIPLRVDAS